MSHWYVYPLLETNECLILNLFAKNWSTARKAVNFTIVLGMTVVIFTA